MTDVCRICDHLEGNRRFVVREMMFGSRRPFDYVECAGCGCLQIAEVPADLGEHYPESYYSFKKPKVKGPLRTSLRAVWARHNTGRPSALGAMLTAMWGQASFFDWIRRAGASVHSRILDVGCGRGRILQKMRSCGFRHVTGVDPFIERDLVFGNGVTVHKRRVEDMDGVWDLVMSHHSLEHVPEQRPFLAELRRLLHDDGCLLVRIPVAGCWPWRHYGTDWFALDAPRHLYLHTRRSMERLARDTGFVVDQVTFDAEPMMLWASEQYRMGIPLMDPRSHWQNPTASPFSKADLARFEARIGELNAAGDSGSAAFYLRRA